MTNIVGLITARGGSKSIPNKNIMLLAGKPLIAWTIEEAMKNNYLKRLIVSTDSPEIARVASDWDAEVPFLRPAEFAQDSSSHVSVIEHAIHWMKKNEGEVPEYILLLQPTSPLRTTEDIDGAISIALERDADSVVSVCEANSHPYLTKRIMDDGTLEDFMISEILYLRRQDLPPAFALNGAIFLNRTESLLRYRTFTPKGTRAFLMPPERSLDIDTPWDFYLAELILQDKMRKHYVRNV
jgi:CMP-N-acetylneuraminic acid synthetase